MGFWDFLGFFWEEGFGRECKGFWEFFGLGLEYIGNQCFCLEMWDFVGRGWVLWNYFGEANVKNKR